MSKPIFIVQEYPVLGKWSVMRLEPNGEYVPYSEYHSGHTRKNAEDLLKCVIGYSVKDKDGTVHS